MTKLENLNCDKTQKPKLWQNSKLKLWQNQKNLILTQIKKSNSDKKSKCDGIYSDSSDSSSNSDIL